VEKLERDQSNPFRDLFLLDPGIVFLNHGSFGATPRPVFDTYQHWQLEMEKQPVEFLARRAPALLRNARSILAGFLNCETDRVVFVTNATVGLNIVARSLRFSAGDQVLTTNHEYGALDRTWKFLSARSGFEYVTQPIFPTMDDPGDIVEQLWRGVTANTKVIFISHITSPTAMIIPVKEICRRAQDEGILTVVDGAHAPGHIDLDLRDLDADFYVGNLHKWLCAPKGAAFLAINPRVEKLVEPLVVSWGWQADNPGPSQLVDYLEWGGTRDLSAFLAVPKAIEVVSSVEWKHRQRYCLYLTTETRRSIEIITGIPAFVPDRPSWYRQMAAMPLPRWIDCRKTQARLYEEFRIEVPLIEWQGHRLIRFSFQVYNQEEDMHALEHALSVILANK
jgi:isopenicillin-N epimerase